MSPYLTLPRIAALTFLITLLASLMNWRCGVFQFRHEPPDEYGYSDTPDSYLPSAKIKFNLPYDYQDWFDQHLFDSIRQQVNLNRQKMGRSSKPYALSWEDSILAIDLTRMIWVYNRMSPIQKQAFCSDGLGDLLTYKHSSLHFGELYQFAYLPLSDRGRYLLLHFYHLECEVWLQTLPTTSRRLFSQFIDSLSHYAPNSFDVYSGIGPQYDPDKYYPPDANDTLIAMWWIKN